VEKLIRVFKKIFF